MDRRVVITGTGVVSPLGTGTDVLFERWLRGEVGIAGHRAACDDFEPSAVLSRKEVRWTSRYVQLALVAAHEAIARAGWLDGLPVDPERIACIVGTCYGGVEPVQRQTEVLAARGPGRVDALAGPMMLPDSAAGAVAIRFGLKGLSHCVASACAAGTDSIGSAVRLIRSGELDAALAGGAEAALTELTDAASMRIGAVSPSGISRPFDARRDGFVPGEGAGIMVLEEAEAATARGAEVLGEVLGYGATTDAYDITAPAPDGAQAARAIALALSDAGAEPGQIAYVNAHGTSTKLNDKVETQAIKAALGEEVARRTPISSTKSVIGHTMGAAGAIETISALEALRRGSVPPTVGLEEADPELDLDYVPGEARALNGGPGRRLALSNSFGFGGHNSVLCVGVDAR